MSEKGLVNKVIDSAKKFNIAGMPGNTIENFNLCGIPGLKIDKTIKNLTETGSAILPSKEKH